MIVERDGLPASHRGVGRPPTTTLRGRMWGATSIPSRIATSSGRIWGATSILSTIATSSGRGLCLTTNRGREHHGVVCIATIRGRDHHGGISLRTIRGRDITVAIEMTNFDGRNVEDASDILTRVFIATSLALPRYTFAHIL
jgi:hypothetical protein